MSGTVTVADILALLRDDRFLPTREAAQFIGIDSRTLLRSDCKRYQPKIGGKDTRLYLFRKSDLLQWIEKYAVVPQDQAIDFDLHNVYLNLVKKRTA